MNKKMYDLFEIIKTHNDSILAHNTHNLPMRNKPNLSYTRKNLLFYKKNGAELFITLESKTHYNNGN